MSHPKSFRGLALLLLLPPSIGMVAGSLHAGITVWLNNWSYYGLYNLVLREYQDKVVIWIQALYVLAIAALGLRFILSIWCRKESRRDYLFCLFTAVAAGAGLSFYRIFHINRYAFKSYWQLENAQTIWGINVPAGLLSEKVILTNVGLLILGMLCALLVFKIVGVVLGKMSVFLNFGEKGSAWPVLAGIGLTIGLTLLLVAKVQQGGSDHPNVILISVDTLRADHLSCYGYPFVTSPNIDGLAQDGVTFENAIAQSNWTLPSHISVMTSQVPLVHGVNKIEKRLPDFKVTLAEVLKNAGYATVAFTGGYNVDARFGFDQGFDVYHGDKVRYLVAHEKRQYAQGVRFANLLPRVAAWLSKTNGQPFFLFLHFWDTHTPYLPHEGYIENFSEDYHGSIELVTNELAAAVNRGDRDLSKQDVARIRALYDNEILYVDHYLGQFFNTLKQLNLYKETLIVLTSDHGEELLEHGMMNHSMALYEPEIHVPLVITYPEVAPPHTRVSRVVQTIDIFPTILELANIRIPERVREQMQGVSLVDSWNGQQDDSLAFSQTSLGTQLCLRTRTHKYIYHQEKDGTPLREELYNLLEDRDELTNLVETEPELTEHMRQRLNEFIDGFSEVPFAGTARDARIDNDFLRRLESLGYVR